MNYPKQVYVKRYEEDWDDGPDVSYVAETTVGKYASMMDGGQEMTLAVYKLDRLVKLTCEIKEQEVPFDPISENPVLAT